MNYGFFSSSEINPAKQRLAHSSQCGACSLFRHCKSPKMPYRGQGKRKILVVGQAPGKNEDEVNEQFVGKAGKRLKRELKRFKIDLNIDCWKTNAVRCHIEGNKAPDSKTIAKCRPALFAEINELQPEHILLFGSEAAESVLGHLWGSSEKFSMATWTDWVIPHQGLNAWISVHYHPSYLERCQDDLLDLLFRRGLKKALRKKGRPWKATPSFSDEVEVIYNPVSAILAVKELQNLFAFDYEATCLKPEYKGAEIISCSFSDGRRTFAFPWFNETTDIVSEVLRSKKYRKIAANIKFEERWTKHFLGHRVRNWDWDTMLSSHVLNNARGITGLKFQSFVRLGQEPYDRHIEPYLKSGRGQHINRIKEIPLKDLLVYNGMDSLCEYKLAAIQKQETDNGSR